ncbi:hypothetical protein IMG5_102190, partial [Ichthyophthirius multifiliis]
QNKKNINKKILLMNKTLLLLVLLGLTTFVLADVVIDTSVYEKATKCHESCFCEQTDTKCAECNICTSCRHPTAHIIENSYCVCDTPRYVQGRTKEGQWTCEKVVDPVPVRNCEWQLFNQIFNMVIVSNCYISTNENNQNTVVDVLSYNWQRLSLQLDPECQNELNTTLLWSPSCGDDKSYVPLDSKYFKHEQGTTTTVFEASLMDIYSLSSNQPQVGERSIFQVICLAVQLSNAYVPIRLHKFQLRIFTNRDQVEVFHLDVSKQITDGCDKGQQCIVVANLDTRGDICTSEACTGFLPEGSVPKYIVGDYLYVRIQFLDNTYTNYLQVQTVKFTDDRGVYSYNKNTQWWQINQQKGLVDVKVLLWQPQVNCKVEVTLKITLQPDSRLRALSAESTTGKVTKQNFQIEVAQSSTKNAQLENNSSFSAKLFCGLILAALALLF